MKLLTVFWLFAVAAFAQAATHSATLVWTDPSNPVGTTYSIYRAQGLCSGTPTFSKIATAIAVKTYQDASVTPGNYCYAVTATFQSVESAQSVGAAAAIPTFAPLNVVVTVQ